MQRVPEQEIMETRDQAQAYNRANFEDAHQAVVQLYGELLPHRGLTGTILDIGCGPADITSRFAVRFSDAKFIGLDGSEEMLKEAANRIARDPLVCDRITFVQDNINTFQPDIFSLTGNDYFDGAISTNTLHHMHNPQEFWDLIWNITVPGSIIFVSDLMRPENEQQAQMIVEQHTSSEPEILKRDFYNSLLAAFTVDEIEEQLQKAGLSELTVQPWSDRHLVVYGVRKGCHEH